MITVMLLLVIAAFAISVANAMGKAPLWAAVIILCVIELIRDLPLR